MNPDEERQVIRELLAIKTFLGTTGRYGVFCDLTGQEIEFWVEEFGEDDLLLSIKHSDPRVVLGYVREKCETLNLMK